MASVLVIHPPASIEYEAIDSTSVSLTWSQTANAESYEVRGGGYDWVRPVAGRSTVIRGLRPSARATIEVRSVCGEARSEWGSVVVRPSESVQTPTTDGVGVIDVIDADRQSVQMRLPNADGKEVEVKLKLWWSPSDQSWWGGIEVPTNTPAIRSRNLSLNCGLLDGDMSVLAGNIVMRATQLDSEEEPTRRSFVEKTHRLVWEPRR